jgi:hypothetical protein
MIVIAVSPSIGRLVSIVIVWISIGFTTVMRLHIGSATAVVSVNVDITVVAILPGVSSAGEEKEAKENCKNVFHARSFSVIG